MASLSSAKRKWEDGVQLIAEGLDKCQEAQASFGELREELQRRLDAIAEFCDMDLGSVHIEDIDSVEVPESDDL